MNELDMIREQHLNNYKNAVLEIIKNNTNSLIDDDIMSLIKEPPLDSMDVIKSKILSVAKNKKIVVKTDEMNRVIELYRNSVMGQFSFFRKLRIDELSKNISSFSGEKDYEVIKITKKQFSDLNKKFNTHLKKSLSDFIEKLLICKLEQIFILELEQDQFREIHHELSKYFKSNYKKQLIENINFKMLVKDTTLINGVKEQGERYIFTKSHSRINQIENIV